MVTEVAAPTDSTPGYGNRGCLQDRLVDAGSPRGRPDLAPGTAPRYAASAPVGSFEARLHRTKGDEAADHETRSHEQNQRHGDLGDDQHLAGAET